MYVSLSTALTRVATGALFRPVSLAWSNWNITPLLCGMLVLVRNPPDLHFKRFRLLSLTDIYKQKNVLKGGRVIWRGKRPAQEHNTQLYPRFELGRFDSQSSAHNARPLLKKKKFMHVLKTPPPSPITSLVLHPLGQHDPVFSSYLSLFPSFFPAPSVFHLYPACLPAHLVQSTVHCWTACVPGTEPLMYWSLLMTW